MRLATGSTDATAQQSWVFESAYGQAKVRERLGVPEGTNIGAWERGFPALVVGSFRDLRGAWPRLAHRVPIKRLHIYEATAAEVAEFTTWPALVGLRELVLNAQWMSPAQDVLSAVAGCAALRGLESLIAVYALLTDATVTAVLNSPHLAGLKSLQLSTTYGAPPLKADVADRLRARFGADVLV